MGTRFSPEHNKNNSTQPFNYPNEIVATYCSIYNRGCDAHEGGSKKIQV